LGILEVDHRIIRPPFRSAYVAHDENTEWKAYIGKTIGVSFFSQFPFDDPFGRRVLSGLLFQLEPSGMRLGFSTRNWHWLMDRLHTPASHFGTEDVEGIVHVGRPQSKVMASFRKLSVPMVAVDFDETAEGMDSFCFADFEAGRQLGERLVQLGHRRIAAVFEDPEKPKGSADEAWTLRREGFMAALEASGLALSSTITIDNRGHLPLILQPLNDLLACTADDRPTALYIPWDFLPALRELAKTHGVKIPRDLTVVGCTGAETASDLTSMRFDGSELGAEAAIHLLRKIRDPNWARRKARLTKVKGQYTAGRSHARPRDRKA
jgi:DNA-binding LacI/PurR family transcriptional regulator